MSALGAEYITQMDYRLKATGKEMRASASGKLNHAIMVGLV